MNSLELFAGAGGLAMGVGRAGFTPAAIVEWDRWCCDTLRENRGKKSGPLADWPEPTEGDIRPVDFRPYLGKIDLVAGGPPCQPFSLGGRHRADLDHRDMWPEAVRVVRETLPRAFIFENVKGLMRATFTPYRNYIHLQLQHPSLKRRKDESWSDHYARLQRRHASKPPEYNVLPPEILNAADLGVPQRRERVFFVGFRADLGVEWEFPQPTHSLEALAWSQRAKGDYWDRHRVAARGRVLSTRMSAISERVSVAPQALPWRTLRDAIGDLPDPEREPTRSAKIANHRFQPGARAYPGHVGSPLDEPAKTLKAGVHGVPGGENMLARPDGTFRYFTVRESARLQTFPDDYVFHGAWSECMRQLGNAVPVDLASAMARDVMRALER
jgi:DNA (cytosine-5)-methyltransferase 1